MYIIEILSFFLIVIIIFSYSYFWNRREKYFKFRHIDVPNLCFNYNLWRISKGDSYLRETLDSANNFCRNKFPLEIPKNLLFSFKTIDMNSMFTDEMKKKFEDYLNSND